MADSCDVLVVGAGIWGCTVARVLAERGKRVLVLERRNAVGGNCRCETDPESQIEVHVYGSHIFHTHIDRVWKFVNRFVSFNGYQHKVLALHEGKMYFLPLSLALVNSFFNVTLVPEELPEFMKRQDRQDAIFNAFFRNYTSKQWGKAPEEIDPGIIKRVPVRATYDVNYFNDYHQGIPESGYNSLFERMLNHENITVETGCEYRLGENRGASRVYCSAPIDSLFDYKFGALPWRTLRFETERVNVADVQGTSVVNYVDADVPWTRQHEYKHFHPENADVMAKELSIICREYSAEWKIGDEPYYPVKNDASEELLARYRQEAAKYDWLSLGGRLGDFKYFDMDKSIDAALEMLGCQTV